MIYGLFLPWFLLLSESTAPSESQNLVAVPIASEHQLSGQESLARKSWHFVGWKGGNTTKGMEMNSVNKWEFTYVIMEKFHHCHICLCRKDKSLIFSWIITLILHSVPLKSFPCPLHFSPQMLLFLPPDDSIYSLHMLVRVALEGGKKCLGIQRQVWKASENCSSPSVYLSLAWEIRVICKTPRVGQVVLIKCDLSQIAGERVRTECEKSRVL